ncbi:TPA: hypothetical protein EYO12_04440 [Candidatus Saccharibacteria bacterium]|nr:hypothetical protein [Candidatus Saccharibacteria bacterium]HIO87716.1 hypothetical protein [Candidatus Saccharibacteria bacterium]
MNIKINLLPDIILQQRREAFVKKVIDFVFIGFMGLLVLVWLILQLLVASSNSSVTSITEEKQQLSEEVNSDANIAIRNEAAKIQNALDSLIALYETQSKPAELLRKLAAVVPEDVIISELSQSDEGLISVTGTSTSNEFIAQFIAGLLNTEKEFLDTEENTEGYFTGTALSQTVLGDEGVYSYNITTEFVPSFVVFDDITEGENPTGEELFEDIENDQEGAQ